MLQEKRPHFATGCTFKEQLEGETGEQDLLLKKKTIESPQVFSTSAMELNSLYQQTKALQKKKQQNYLFFSIYTLLMVFFVAISLHGHSEYLKFYHKNKYLQQEAMPVYEFCNKGYPGYSNAPPASLNCHLFAKHATMNIHIESLENTVMHLLDDVNIFKLLMCNQSETCRFIAFYATTTVFGSFHSVVLFACILMCVTLYLYIKGPLASKRAFRNQTHKQKEKDITNEISSDMKQVWQKLTL